MNALFSSRKKFETHKSENEVKDALVNAVKESVREVQYEAKELKRDVLDLCEATSNLCITLEAIFLHGLKDSLLWQTLSVISGDGERRPEPSFWSPLMVFLHKQVLDQLLCLNQVNTEIGQCRAWIRLALNECVLSAYMKNMHSNSSALRPYYRAYALLKDAERFEIITRIIEGLEADVGFNLPINTSLLNQWSDNALQMSGLWSPTLKSVQIASGVDVAGTLTNVIPTPRPLQSNEVFQESISNSPFASAALSMMNSARVTNVVDEISQRMQEIDVIDEESEAAIRPLDPDELLAMSDNSANNFCAHGNSLSNLMQSSWSGETSINSKRSISQEDEATTPSLQRTLSTDSSTSSLRGLLNRTFSYNALLQFHERSRPVDWTELWEKFLLHSPVPQDEPAVVENTPSDNTLTDDFEIIDNMGNYNIDELQDIVEQLGRLPHESGLNAQEYSCPLCQQALGFGCSNHQVCSFTGNYYCKNCMAKEQFLIPARVIHNWDFRKYAVSKKVAIFLNEFADQPFIDLKLVNPHIYEAIAPMAELQTLRIRLNFIRAYLVTCGDAAKAELQRYFFGREYLYEHIHQYSIADLSLLQRGTLQQMLQKACKALEAHILKCTLCSLKGFICEICKSPQVLYPFHITTTFRCKICGSVFHPVCLNEEQPCPKCLRIRKREQQQEELEAAK